MAKRIRVDIKTEMFFYLAEIGEYGNSPENANEKSHSAEYSVPDEWIRNGTLTQEGRGAIEYQWFGAMYSAYEPARRLIVSWKSEILGEAPDDEAEELVARIRRMRQGPSPD